MKEILLYITTIVIWGSTWIAIKFQLGPVDPMISVIYRFGLAAAVLICFCRIRGLSLKFSLKDHCFMALMGVFLFSVNYWLVYLAEAHLTSGLVAVLFSSLVFFNMINSSLFLGAPVEKKTIAGAVAGIMGICLIFLPEIRAFDAAGKGLMGIAVGMASVFLASLGNIASARNTKNNIPVIQANAFGMTYGTLVLVILALFMGKEFNFSFSLPYTGSLCFLSVFGSVVAFGTYLTLVGSLGAGKAAYAIMVVPVVALAISSFAEGYVWTVPAVAGLIMVLAGNWLALSRRPG